MKTLIPQNKDALRAAKALSKYVSGFDFSPRGYKAILALNYQGVLAVKLGRGKWTWGSMATAPAVNMVLSPRGDPCFATEVLVKLGMLSEKDSYEYIKWFARETRARQDPSDPIKTPVLEPICCVDSNTSG